MPERASWGRDHCVLQRAGDRFDERLESLDPRHMTKPATDPLTRNLLALRDTQLSIFERVHLPVEGDHLARDERGRWVYHLNQSAFELGLSAEELAARVELALSERTADAPLLLFGLGTGDLLEALLERAPGARIVAWDRDPWVLRQVLIARDWSEAIESGALRFALNADLIELALSEEPWCVVDHPLLGRVYHHERRLLDEGVSEKRALLAVGSLFVDSVADALRALGYSVFSYDVKRLAAEELALVLRQYRPQLLAGINYVHGLAEFCERHSLDYLCWEIDPATDVPSREADSTTHTRIFTYRAANVPLFRRAGFEHVEYLPLAADPARRRPVVLDEVERERYVAPVSFVGTSLCAGVEEFRRAFVASHAAWRPGSEELARACFAELVAAQREDLATFLVPEHLERRLPGFREFCRRNGLQDPVLLVAEVSAAEKRLNYVAALSEAGVQVWGDPGWKMLEPHGVRWRGPALHETDVPLIYNASTINLDIGRLYQSDIVTMRIFDILACGGFVLAEHSVALEELFEIGDEIESYRTLDELREKVAHYLADPDEARFIAERGRRAVLTRHVIAERVRYMVERVAGGARSAA